MKYGQSQALGSLLTPLLSEVLPAVTAVRAVLGYTPIYSEDNLLQTA